MEKNVSKSQVKKEAINVLTQEMISPFAVMNAINKNRNNPAIAEALKLYGIDKKMSLESLLSINTGSERDIFCKLRKVSDIDFLDGNELKVIRIKNNYFEYVPIKFTINEFFASMDSVLKINNEQKRIQEAENKQVEKQLAKEAKKANRQESKKAQAKEKEAQRIAAKAKELSGEYTDVPENVLLQIAADLLKKAA